MTRPLLVCLFWSALATTALVAQFKIEYPELPPDPPPEGAVEAAAEPAEPPKPVYSGSPVEIPAYCPSDMMERLSFGCSEEHPCDVSLELLGAIEAEGRLFVYGDVFAPTGTLSSIILTSEDGGGSWTEAHQSIAGAIFEIGQFADKTRGFIAGQREGEGAANRPFLLVTDDGGASWERRDIVSGGEQKPGAIVAMRFDSGGHGHLILERIHAEVDRFEMYETFNAGRSWSVRAVSSERPAMPGARRIKPPETLRVIEDGEEYLLQGREEGEAWALFARFARDMGVCP